MGILFSNIRQVGRWAMSDLSSDIYPTKFQRSAINKLLKKLHVYNGNLSVKGILVVPSTQLFPLYMWNFANNSKHKDLNSCTH